MARLGPESGGAREADLLTSDAHQGLKGATATIFAGASWQRCRTHFMANLLFKIPLSRAARRWTTTAEESCTTGTMRDEKGLNWEPGGVRSRAGVRRSGAS